MNSNAIKYSIGIVMVALLGYHSVYFQPLDERLADNQQIEFDAKAFVNGIWSNELLKVFIDAPEISLIIDSLNSDVANTFERYGSALGIGNIGYFRIKGEGTVSAINENNVMVQTGSTILEIETEFVYGNAVRDASGLVKVNDYDNTSDFNSISESINEKIREEVIPEFRAKVKTGNRLKYQGAIELNQAHLNLKQIEVIPVTLQIIQ